MITESVIKKIAPSANKTFIKPLVEAMSVVLPEYGINTSLRAAHFLAQAAHESDGFKTLREYWGPTKAQKGYEGRKDLGNTKKGDGKRFMGRGIFQLTGRANYRRIGEKLNLPLEANPELAADPRNAVQIAAEYWKSRKLNAPADRDDIITITERINGGFNGIQDRRRYLSRAKAALGASPVALLSPETPEPAPAREASPDAPAASGEPVNEAPITPASGTVLIRALQTELKARHYYDGDIDGKPWGTESLTGDAIVLLQTRNDLPVERFAIEMRDVLAAKPYVVAAREDATVKTMIAKGEPRVTFWSRIKKAAVGVLGFFGISQGSSALDQAEQGVGVWSRVKGLFEPFAGATEFLAAHWPWFAAGGAAVLIGVAIKQQGAALLKYKTGS